MIFYVDGFLILVFVAIVVALIIKAGEALSGVIGIIAMAVFIVEAIASLCFLIRNIKDCKKWGEHISKAFVLVISSATELFVSFLFLHEMGTAYDLSNLWDLFVFLFGGAIIAVPWLLSIKGWIDVHADEPSGYIEQIIGCGVMFFIYYGL